MRSVVNRLTEAYDAFNFTFNARHTHRHSASWCSSIEAAPYIDPLFKEAEAWNTLEGAGCDVGIRRLADEGRYGTGAISTCETTVRW
jgi:hypothetical protein